MTTIDTPVARSDAFIPTTATPPASPSAPETANPSSAPVEASATTQPRRDAIVLDSADGMTSADLLAALAALKDALRSNQTESYGLDIQYGGFFASQLNSASLDLVSKKTVMDQAGDAASQAFDQKDKALAALQTAKQSSEQASQTLEQAQAGLQQARNSLKEKEDLAAQAGEAVRAAQQAAEQAQAAAQAATERAENAAPEEQAALQAAAREAQASAQSAQAQLLAAQETQSQAVQAVDQASAAVSQQEIRVSDAQAGLSAASATLASAQSSYDSVTVVYNNAREDLNKATQDVKQAQNSVQAATETYNAVMNLVDQRLQALQGDDLAQQDSTGAAAILASLISSGAALAAALTSTILQSNVPDGYQSGLSHDAKIKLLNQVAGSEGRVKQAEQDEQTVMKSELSADLAQLFIGTLSAFSVFGISKFNEVMAIAPGLVDNQIEDTNIEDTNSTDNSRNDKKVGAGLAQLQAARSDMADLLQEVLDSAGALLASSDTLAETISAKPYRGVLNKV